MSETMCMSEVRGQENAVRAATVAAAGGLSLLLVGPPGSGRTMLARRITTILPGLTFREAVHVTDTQARAGQLREDALVRERPFRAPHHTASPMAVAGSGSLNRVGEVQLAAHGVLFLDEVLEFQRACVDDALWAMEPYESRPPRPAVLVGATSSCPCGFADADARECSCSWAQRSEYARRIHNLGWRFDLVARMEPQAFSGAPAPTSERLRASVTFARLTAQARARERGCSGSLLSPEGDPSDVRGRPADFPRLESPGRVQRVVRVLADLDACDAPEERHWLEALRMVYGV